MEVEINAVPKKGRSLFKPAINLSDDQVKAILIEKIQRENNQIPYDKADELMLENLKYNKEKINVVGLFSGCGGLDLGFELAGLISEIGEDNALKAFKNKEAYNNERSKSIFHTVYTNDLFKEANESYAQNFPNHVIQHQKDIRKVSHFPICNLMLGGFPCPGFSEAGPRLIDDERNFLYIHFIRALLQTQPEFFVAENVKGMMTLGKGEVLRQIVEDFSSAGYTVTPYLVNAKDYGVPQSRDRVFLIGVHKEKIEEKYDYKYELPSPTHGVAPKLIPYVTLRDAIKDLKENPGPFHIGDFSPMYLSRNRKKTWDDVSFTIQASGRQAPLHPGGMPMEKVSADKWNLIGENRRLSVKEVSRIQTFPDWFEFSSGKNQNISGNGLVDKQYKQIGNAVPVMLAKSIAMPIAQFLSKLKKDENLESSALQLKMF
ncbi:MULTISPECIES: DNA cytosine methyltransferase [unclassified Exiguobacterium]|uniref:DNA cytosine methyltransferase n=1 Tax=unclassified Exiguobacterium TaxID=2644629 RepID=UPI0025C06711|nr:MULTISPECIES: DNA cytosine methyltransferase [unclassified Exiguobacterium]